MEQLSDRIDVLIQTLREHYELELRLRELEEENEALREENIKLKEQHKIRQGQKQYILYANIPKSRWDWDENDLDLIYYLILRRKMSTNEILIYLCEKSKKYESYADGWKPDSGLLNLLGIPWFRTVLESQTLPDWITDNPYIKCALNEPLVSDIVSMLTTDGV